MFTNYCKLEADVRYTYQQIGMLKYFYSIKYLVIIVKPLFSICLNYYTLRIKNSNFITVILKRKSNVTISEFSNIVEK